MPNLLHRLRGLFTRQPAKASQPARSITVNLNGAVSDEIVRTIIVPAIRAALAKGELDQITAAEHAEANPPRAALTEPEREQRRQRARHLVITTLTRQNVSTVQIHQAIHHAQRLADQGHGVHTAALQGMAYAVAQQAIRRAAHAGAST